MRYRTPQEALAGVDLVWLAGELGVTDDLVARWALGQVAPCTIHRRAIESRLGLPLGSVRLDPPDPDAWRQPDPHTLDRDPSPVTPEIGREVRALREAAGLTQAALGDLVGCSETAVRGIETGRVSESSYVDAILDELEGAS